MRKWLVCGLLGALMSWCAAQGEDIVLQVVPRRVYVASDGVVPRWRVMLVAVNKTSAAVTLEQVQVSLVTAAAATTATYRGDRLKEVVPGHREAAPGRPIIMYLADDGKAPGPPEHAEVALSLKVGDSAVSKTWSLDLKPRTTTYYRFPLRGRWIVANGREAQHGGGIAFAFDLMKPQDYDVVFGPSDHDPPLTDFEGYGQPVLSPVAGRVVAARGDRPDVAPSLKQPSFAGKIPADRTELVGNYLVMDAGHGRFMFLAHFKQGSLQVQVGDEVCAGQPLARVGNSGNTNAPHLHIEVLDGAPDLPSVPRIAQSGLPFGFRSVRVERDGVVRRLGHCIPVQRQMIYGDDERASE
ncbi:M23 family metallopeptidase [bacterium]|nr:M23 family metallopeptidase [bacterium]